MVWMAQLVLLASKEKSARLALLEDKVLQVQLALLEVTEQRAQLEFKARKDLVLVQHIILILPIHQISLDIMK
jgi:hypothetical protein